MSRQDVIRRIVERDQQHLGLNEETVTRDDPALRALACDAFGTWEIALRYAGVTWQRTRVNAEFSPTAVKREIRRLCREEYNLASRHIRQRNRHLYDAARRHFGTWRNALRSAGVDPRHAAAHPRLNREQVLAALQQRRERGLSLKRIDVCLENRGFVRATKTVFGSWGKALAALNGQTGPPMPSTAADEEIQRVIAVLQQREREGKSLARDAVNRDHRGLVPAVRRCFGSWRTALAAAGVTSRRAGRRARS